MDNWGKAKEIRKRLEKEMPENKNKVVAIDTDSGDYFIGETALDASKLARKKYPDKIFICERLGYDYLYFVGAFK